MLILTFISLSHTHTHTRQQHTGRDVVLMSDVRTFHWMSGNANEYLDFGKAIVESMEQTLSKRRHANNHEKVIFWDIACGSGWMSQYVAASLSDSLSRIVASDIDSIAVSLTKQVTKVNGFEDLIHVKQGDLLEPFQGESPADFIYMYPPQMNHEIAKTKGARFSSAPVSLFLEMGTDMRHFFDVVIDHIHTILKPGGTLFLGIDHNHVESVISYVVCSNVVVCSFIYSIVIQLEQHRYVHKYASMNVANGLHNGLRVRLIYGKFIWDPSYDSITPSVLIEIEREELCAADGGVFVNHNTYC